MKYTYVFWGNDYEYNHENIYANELFKVNSKTEPYVDGLWYTLFANCSMRITLQGVEYEDVDVEKGEGVNKFIAVTFQEASFSRPLTGVKIKTFFINIYNYLNQQNLFYLKVPHIIWQLTFRIKYRQLT